MQTCPGETNKIVLSYVRDDAQWAKGLAQLLLRNNYTPVLFLPNKPLSEYLVFIVITSQSYFSCGAHNDLPRNVLKMKENCSNVSVKQVLDCNSLLCVHLWPCDLPDGFQQIPMLAWFEEEIPKVFWNKLFNFLAAAQKAMKVRCAIFNTNKISSKNAVLNETNNNAIGDKAEKSVNKEEVISNDATLNGLNCLKPVDHNKVDVSEIILNENPLQNVAADLDREIDDDDDDGDDETADNENNKAFDYAMFPNVLPHLINYSFEASDDDLTTEDLDELTLKMEDLNVMLDLKPVTETPTQLTENDDDERPKCGEFDSPQEQMKVLHVLQEQCDRLSDKLKTTARGKNCVRRWHRMLEKYNKAIVRVASGKKVDEFPWLNLHEENENQCVCCEAIFHSERALEMHFERCVHTQWSKLMKE